MSNGPLLELRVNDQGPGATVKTTGLLRLSANVISRLPFERVEILCNGEVIAEQTAWKKMEAKLEREIEVDRGGWIAARVSGGGKTYAGYTVFAHTSPVYVRMDGTPHRHAEAAGAFVDEIENSIRSSARLSRLPKTPIGRLRSGSSNRGALYLRRLRLRVSKTMSARLVVFALLPIAAVCQDSSLHRNAFVMDGHIHVMTRELLQGTDIGQRYPDGSVDLVRAKAGGLDAMFFSVYTPSPTIPDGTKQRIRSVLSSWLWIRSRKNKKCH